MKLIFCKCLFVVGMSWILTSAWANVSTTWQTLQPGLEYTKIEGFDDSSGGRIHVFRLDLKRYQLKFSNVPQNNDLPEENFKQLLSANHVLLMTNGGFFTPELKPLGLRITENKQTNPIKNISWWSIFMIKNKRAYIIPQSAYHADAGIEFAVQAGPRLIVGGEKTKGLNNNMDARTALGITQDHKVILLTTENVLLSTDKLAEIMQKTQSAGGLDCVEAINLDGGHSAQMYASLPNFSLDISNESQVADAVLVVPRENG